MSVLSHYTRNKLYGCLFGLDTFDKPDIYVGLAVSDPEDSSGDTFEPVNSDYNRVYYDKWDIRFRTVANRTTVPFPTKSAWGVARYFLLWDSLIEGNLLGYGLLDESVNIVSGRTVSFSKGRLSFGFNIGTATDYLVSRYLNHLFGHTSLSPVSDSYVGLSYISPGITGTPRRPGFGYSDVEYGEWFISDISHLSNLTSIDFPIPEADWGLIPYVFVRDDVDRVLLYATLDRPVPADTYSPVVFGSGDLTFIFD